MFHLRCLKTRVNIHKLLVFEFYGHCAYNGIVLSNITGNMPHTRVEVCSISLLTALIYFFGFIAVRVSNRLSQGAGE